MAIITTCPECGQQLEAPDSAAGKRARCPDCGGTVQMPRPAAEPADDFLPDDAGYGEDYGDPQLRRQASRHSEGDQQRRPCPMCGEMIVATARICRFCGEAVGDTKRSHHGTAALGSVRTGIIIIYYGLVALLTCAIFLAVVAFLMRRERGPAETVLLVGMLCGIVAMFVGKFFCLGVPATVGASGLIYASCAIDVVSILMQVLRFTVGIHPALAVATAVAGLAGTMLFLFFLKSVAGYIGRDDHARLAVTVIIMTGVTIGINLLIVLLAFARVAEAMRGQAPGAGFGGALSWFGLAFLVVGTVTLCLYARLLTYLKDAL